MRLIAIFVAAVFGIGLVAVIMSRPVPAFPGPGTPSGRDQLVGRFIDRSQRFRRSGAIVGLILMSAYLVAADAVGRSGVELNLLLFASIGLAGSIGGSILAEAFRVRHPGPRTASLEVRDPAAYRDRSADRRERVLLVLAAAGVVGSAVTGEHLARVIALGIAVVVLAVVRHWAVRRIALRPRPVVPAALAAADDEVRRMATSAGTSRPMVTLGALAISAQWSAVVASGPDLPRATQVVSVVAWLGSIALFCAGCIWWWTNRSFGLTPLHLDAVGGRRSHLVWWALGVIGLCLAMMALVVFARETG